MLEVREREEVNRLVRLGDIPNLGSKFGTLPISEKFLIFCLEEFSKTLGKDNDIFAVHLFYEPLYKKKWQVCFVKIPGRLPGHLKILGPAEEWRKWGSDFSVIELSYSFKSILNSCSLLKREAHMRDFGKKFISFLAEFTYRDLTPEIAWELWRKK